MSLARRQRNRASVSAGPAGFDFTLHLRRLCDDMVARVEPLRHVDMARMAMSFSQTRKATPHGMYASLTPLRFADGAEHTTRRGRRWGVQRLYDESGREMLYILNFYLPRFLNLEFREKLTTVVHELWHVSPDFNGDVRRFAGRCFAHGSSQKKYDRHVETLVDRWLDAGPPEALYDFLKLDFRQLMARHGRVFGQKLRSPKLVPLD